MSPQLTGFRVERANYRVVLLDALARGDGHTALALFAAARRGSGGEKERSSTTTR